MPILPDRYCFSRAKNPRPVDTTQNSVWLMDNTAFRLDNVPDNATRFPHQKSSHTFIDPALEKQQPKPPPRWQVEYVVAYFAEKLDHDPTTVAKAVCKKIGLKEDDSALETIKTRLEPFVTPILPRATIRVNIDNVETQTLGPGSSFGISSSVNRFHFEPAHNHTVTTDAVIPNPSRQFSLSSTTICAEPYGWAIISDIDDTIKVTQTTSLFGILRSTFIDDPQPVSGMPALYAHLNDRLSSPAWFYLSASPYNLYPFLRSFRQAYYPHGTIILRDASWQNLAGLISSLTMNVQEYKINRIMKIHGWFPKRSFICIGDSTQKDPETYGEIARRFPGWVKAIFIRKVKDVGDGGILGGDEEKTRNSDERFKSAFEGLKGITCYVFDEPEEVKKKVNQILTTRFLPERVIEL